MATTTAYLDVTEQGSAPTTPDTTHWRVYAKSDGLYVVDDAGAETGPFGVAGAAAAAGTPYEVDYVEFTSNVNVTATVEASADTIVSAGAVAFDGSIIAVVEFFTPAARPAASAAASIKYYLYDGASSIGLIAQQFSAAASSSIFECYGTRRLTPSNASHTYSIRAIVSTGTGVVVAGAGGSGNYVPGFIRISKLTA